MADPSSKQDPALEPTIEGAPDASRPSVPTGPALGSGTTAAAVSSPHDALVSEEIARTRIFSRFALAICAAVLLCLAFLGGHPGVKVALAVAVSVCAALLGWLLVVLREPSRYDARKVVFVAWCCAASTLLGVVFWGIFSPAPALIVLGLYFFSRTNSLAATLLVYLTCALGQAALSVVIFAGLIRDPGLFPASGTTRDMAISQGMVQLTYLFSFLLARATRATTLVVLGRLEAAVRQVTRREALLHEAQQDLERALKIGAPGRYTDQVLGGYRLGVIIGRGAMGEVYEAVHTETQEPAAAKLLLPSLLEHPDRVERFLREAQAAGAFTGEHVARVLATSAPGDPLPFLVMEKLHGEDLASYLRRVRRLSPPQLLELVDHVGRVLEQAREQGIVHRDLKPHNVYRAHVSPGRRVWKVLDFGVSKLESAAGTLTHGQVIGTPAYMAPEQARGLDVDHRADLYALAALAYRAVTGQPPFSGPDVPSVLYRVVHYLPLAPSQLAQLLPAVDRVFAVALAKHPDDRFTSADAFHAALARAIDGHIEPALAARADRLLAQIPWGSVLEARKVPAPPRA